MKAVINGAGAVTRMLDTNKAWEAVIGVLLAVTGGVARMLNTKDATRYNIKNIVGEPFVSAFCGVAAILLSWILSLTVYWGYLVCCIAGWTSPNILHAITRMTEKALKLKDHELDDNKKEE